MRSTGLQYLVILAIMLGGHACKREASHDVASKVPVPPRAERRAFDGAPPVRPHGELGMACTECHNQQGRAVEGLGFAPPSPHALTEGLSAVSNCRQCHVLQKTDEVFVASSFVGLPQDLRPGRVASPGAPPVMPHPRFMRENCLACHAGPAARPEIRTPHPERERCVMCHVEQRSRGSFHPSHELR